MRKRNNHSRTRCLRGRRALTIEGLEERALLAVLTVGTSGDFSSIQAAVENASQDDVIEIADGVYEEAVDLSRMGNAIGGSPADLVLRGESLNTILRAPTGAAISNTSAIVGDLTMEGFTIESPAVDSTSHGIDLSNITGAIVVRAMKFQNIAASALSLETITGNVEVRANDFLGTGTTDGINAVLVSDIDGIGVVSDNQFTDVLGTAIRVRQTGTTEALLLVAENMVRGDASFLATTATGIEGSVSGDARLDLSLDHNRIENLSGRAIHLQIEEQAEVQTRWTRTVVTQVGGDAAILLSVAGNSNTAIGAVDNSILDAANDGIRVVVNDSARLAVVVEDNLLLGIGDSDLDVGFRLTSVATATGELAATFLNNDFDTIGGDGLVISPGGTVDATLAVSDNFFTGTNSIGGDAAIVIRNGDASATNSIQAVINGNQLLDGLADAYHVEQQGGTIAIEGESATASDAIAAMNSGSGINVLGSVTQISPGSLASATPRLLGDFVWSDDNRDGLQDVSEEGVELVVVTLAGTEQLGGAAIERQTLTNGFGAYLFSAVLPGDYTLSLIPPAGFVPTTPSVGADTAIDSDVDVTTASVLVTIGEADDLAVDVGLVPGFPWQNPNNFMDVNDDTVVAPIDVLQIINELNLNGSHALSFPTSQIAPPPFFDVNGDNFVSPVDALQVINFLNTSNPEGEANSDAEGIALAELERTSTYVAAHSNRRSGVSGPTAHRKSDVARGILTSDWQRSGRLARTISSSPVAANVATDAIEPLLEAIALDQLYRKSSRQSL